MPLDIVIGGQYGGEGKGHISSFLSQSNHVDIIVKTGGPNCGHTVEFEGAMIQLRMIPAGAASGPSTIVFPAGVLIHVETLHLEIDRIGFNGRIIVDPQAGVVEAEHIEAQLRDPFYQEVGSTLTGTGAATSQRALRRLPLARMEPNLREFLGETSQLLKQALDSSKKILIEGSQGFGLSNYHGDYPFVTNRDTTAAAFLSQAGLSPNIPSRIILVLKTFPTRNRHGKGMLPFELPDSFVERYETILTEYGGGSYGERGARRRIALFDFEIVKKAVRVNGATYLALTGLDRLPALYNEQIIRKHYGSPEEFLESLELRTGVPILIESWGASIKDVRYHRPHKET